MADALPRAFRGRAGGMAFRSFPARTPFDLARLRVSQRINEVRVQDLRFTEPETGEFLSATIDLPVSDEAVTHVQRDVEGWIAGLQLTALSVKGHSNISEYLEKMAGDNRYILDYLMEEVLQQLSQEERDFLLSTSILNRFNAHLCNIMLGIEHSQEII